MVPYQIFKLHEHVQTVTEDARQRERFDYERFGGEVRAGGGEGRGIGARLDFFGNRERMEKQ